MQAIWSWSGENKFFREVTVAWTEAYMDRVINGTWCPSLVSPQVQNGHCWHSLSIQSRSPLAVPYHCSFTQHNSYGHSLFLMRTSSWMARLCQELPAYFARAEVFHLKLSDSKADLAAKKVDWWRQNEDNLPLWAGAVKMVLLIQPSLRLLGEFSLL